MENKNMDKYADIPKNYLDFQYENNTRKYNILLEKELDVLFVLHSLLSLSKLI